MPDDMTPDPNRTDLSPFLAQTALGPQPGLTPGLDPAVQAQLTETPEDKFRKLVNRYVYGMGDKQEKPNKKQKAWGILQTLLSASIGQQNPFDRARALTQKEYPEETARIAQNVGEQRAQNQLIGLQNQLRLKEAALDSLNVWRNNRLNEDAAKLEEQKRNNDLKNKVSTIANDLKKFTAVSAADLRSKQGDLLDVKKKIAQFEADNPNMKPGQLLNIIVGDTEDPAQALKIWQLWNQAKGIGSVTSSSSAQGLDANGNVTTSRQSVRQKLFGPMASPAPQPNQGPYMNPQFQGGQSVPQVAPQAGGPSVPTQANPAAAPQANGAPKTMGDLISTLSDQNAPLETRNIKIRQEQQKRAQELAEEVQKIREFQTQSGLLTNALLSSAAKGGANWRGLLAGHPMLRTAREAYGDVLPENVIDQAMQNFNALGSLKAFQPRFSTQEYAKVLQASGGNTHVSLENAIKSSAFQTLRAELEAGIREGKIKPEDAPKVSNAIIEELNRLGAYAKKPEGKVITPRALLDIMKGRSDAARTLGSGRSRSQISTDDVLNELRKRGK